ncbi:hypothetical protein [Methylocella sp. CPCC 101449]|uniref:hypothetical protein n=1 Tax=Methylocella sp. CPCC 101449 TaxID=2987531 RepID=UPI002891636B|nr:hypothetical protein [Methylocella sp. CPCC 101449]MDT2021272.1 hypothetical protein [Methylocella sp. CPCC 101449]
MAAIVPPEDADPNRTGGRFKLGPLMPTVLASGTLPYKRTTIAPRRSAPGNNFSRFTLSCVQLKSATGCADKKIYRFPSENALRAPSDLRKALGSRPSALTT